MATRSLINFIEVNGKKQSLFASIYKHYDGSLNCLGETISDFLSSKRLVGSSAPVVPEGVTQAFDIGCLVAQFIAENKEGAGDLYLNRPKKKNMQMEGNNVSYIYNIFVTQEKETLRGYQEGGYRVEVIDSYGVLFDGKLDSYVAFLGANFQYNQLYNKLYDYINEKPDSKLANALLRVVDTREYAYGAVPHPVNYGSLNDDLLNDLADLDAINALIDQETGNDGQQVSLAKEAMNFITNHWKEYISIAPCVFSSQALNTVEVTRHYANLLRLLPLIQKHNL